MTDAEKGKALVEKLLRVCWDTGNPVVPTPVAEAVNELRKWARD